MLNTLDIVRGQSVSVDTNSRKLFVFDQYAVLVWISLPQTILPIAPLGIVVFKNVLPCRHLGVYQGLGFVELHLLPSVQRSATTVD